MADSHTMFVKFQSLFFKFVDYDEIKMPAKTSNKNYDDFVSGLINLIKRENFNISGLKIFWNKLSSEEQKSLFQFYQDQVYAEEMKLTDVSKNGIQKIQKLFKKLKRFGYYKYNPDTSQFEGDYNNLGPFVEKFNSLSASDDFKLNLSMKEFKLNLNDMKIIIEELEDDLEKYSRLEFKSDGSSFDEYMSLVNIYEGKPFEKGGMSAFFNHLEIENDVLINSLRDIWNKLSEEQKTKSIQELEVSVHDNID